MTIPASVLCPHSAILSHLSEYQPPALIPSLRLSVPLSTPSSLSSHPSPSLPASQLSHLLGPQLCSLPELESVLQQVAVFRVPRVRGGQGAPLRGGEGDGGEARHVIKWDGIPRRNPCALLFAQISCCRVMVNAVATCVCVTGAPLWGPCTPCSTQTTPTPCA